MDQRRQALAFNELHGVVVDAAFLADRMDRRHLLLGSQYTQMASAFLLTVLIVFGWVRVWHILALSFVTGFAQALYDTTGVPAELPTLAAKR